MDIEPNQQMPMSSRRSKRLAAKSDTTTQQTITNKPKSTKVKYVPYSVVAWENGPEGAKWNCSCSRPLFVKKIVLTMNVVVMKRMKV